MSKTLGVGDILTVDQLRNLYFDPRNGFGSKALEAQIGDVMQSLRQQRAVESRTAYGPEAHWQHVILDSTNKAVVERGSALIRGLLDEYALKKPTKLEAALLKMGVTPDDIARLPHREGYLGKCIDKAALIDIVGIPAHKAKILAPMSDQPATQPPKDWGIPAQTLTDMGLTYQVIKDLPDIDGTIAPRDLAKLGLSEEQIKQLPTKNAGISDCVMYGYDYTAGALALTQDYERQIKDLFKDYLKGRQR